MTTKTPIREAAEAVCVEYLGLTADAVDTEAAHIEEIIKRVLRERVPEKNIYAGELQSDWDAAIGYNQCRKEIGL